VPAAVGSVVKAFSAAARDRLVRDGWRKRAGDIFTRGDGDFIGWLGLNSATKYEPVGINPVVGVRHQELERQVALFMGRKPHAYIPPTLSSPVGYLRPEAAYIEVKVASAADAGEAAEQVAGLVRDHGEPFIAALSGEDAVLAALERGEYVIHRAHGEERLPVMYGLVGRESDARAALEAALASREGRTDAEAAAYRSFALAVERWLGESGA
jgi:hypothetical protein